jgi:hypothetical protein
MGGGADRAATPQAPLRRCLRPGYWSAEEDGYLNHRLSKVRSVPGPGVGAALTACVQHGLITTRDARVPWTRASGAAAPAFVSLHHLGLRHCEGEAVFIPA